MSLTGEVVGAPFLDTVGVLLTHDGNRLPIRFRAVPGTHQPAGR
jgi:hypothetical protein